MGGWVGGWVGDRKVEEDEAVRMNYCELGVGWVGGMSCLSHEQEDRWVGGWVGRWVSYIQT